MHPFTVALTGGIASGKSEVARHFAALGASVIDADVVAHELVQPGMPALAEIASAFGPQMLDAQARLRDAFDPSGRANPQKILPRGSRCGELQRVPEGAWI